MSKNKSSSSDATLILKFEIFGLIEKARYKAAFRKAKSHANKNSSGPVAQYLYAMLLGDNQEGVSKKKIELNRKKASSILLKVVTKIRLVPLEQRYSVLNEYYWFSRQPKKQFQHGKTEIKNGNLNGYYSMGVGGVSYAKALLDAGKVSRARQWLVKAQKAWEAFFKFEPDNTHDS